MIKAHDWQFDWENLLPADEMALFRFFFFFFFFPKPVISFVLLKDDVFLSIAHFLAGTFQNLTKKGAKKIKHE